MFSARGMYHIMCRASTHLSCLVGDSSRSQDNLLPRISVISPVISTCLHSPPSTIVKTHHGNCVSLANALHLYLTIARGRPGTLRQPTRLHIACTPLPQSSVKHRSQPHRRTQSRSPNCSLPQAHVPLRILALPSGPCLMEHGRRVKHHFTSRELLLREMLLVGVLLRVGRRAGSSHYARRNGIHKEERKIQVRIEIPWNTK